MATIQNNSNFSPAAYWSGPAGDQGSTSISGRPRAEKSVLAGTGGIGLDPKPTLSSPSSQNSPVDSTTISSSGAPASTTVKVEPWGKGKNSSVEGILRNQGYSLKEIYTKDANGQTLIDRVASTNGLRNPNLIQPGQELRVPPRGGAEGGGGLTPGGTQSASATSSQTGVTATTRMDRNGNVSGDISTQNRNRDARTTTEFSAGQGATVDHTVGGTRDGRVVGSLTSIRSGDGRTETEIGTRATRDTTSTTIRDRDGRGGLDVATDAEGRVYTSNGNGQVQTATGDSESQRDGAVERFGRGLSRAFGFGERASTVGGATGATEVRRQVNADGSITTTGVVNGRRVTLGAAAGDSDDSLLERGGEAIDNGLRSLGRFVGIG